jgi:hypothetical protein
VLALSPTSEPPTRVTPHCSARLPGLLLAGAGHPDRRAVERFVRRVYAERYGADVRRFAPWLVALRDEAGELVAAAGFRPAAGGPLFLERYLPGPVETLLADEAAAHPAREQVVEVGHLAAARPGEGRRLILMLGPLLSERGFQWVVSTLTEELRHLFVRLGITPIALGVADPSRLGADAARWGSYYDHHPLVLAGHLDAALRVLARRRALA